MHAAILGTVRIIATRKTLIMRISGLNIYSTTISRTFKSATNSGTFENATKFFFFAFLDDLGNFKQKKN